jgi:hypothetical protein
MDDFVDFKIESVAEVSMAFRNLGCKTFYDASLYVKQLPYKRNSHKLNLLVVLKENCGTCSTKHGLLYALAKENKAVMWKLILCLYEMNATNTPPAKRVLDKYQLTAIPEAHNYLKCNEQKYDFTFPNSEIFIDDAILFETEIIETQLGDYKAAFHKKYLTQWCNKNKATKYSAGELWKIREEIIENLE